MNKLELLKSIKEETEHNLLCFSANYDMTIPKTQYTSEWKIEKEKLSLIDEMIKEEQRRDLPYGTIINYKGYVCFVGDYNYDNDKESIIDIYKSKKDYKIGNRLETVSLNNENLRKNIKEFMDEFYIVSKKENIER